jgi:hypothetical protein
MLTMNALFGVILASLLAPGDQPSTTQRVAAATAKAAEATYQLRYKFTPGEVVKTKVTHLVTMDTKIQGVSQTDKSRSISTKVWQIQKVTDDGKITLINSIESVDMWQQSSGRQEVHFNSASSEKPPPQYEAVKKTIGKPLATITIDPHGKVLERLDAFKSPSNAIGDLTITFPGKPLKIGQEWNIPQVIPVPMDARFVQVKIRQVFTLEKVETGIATIAVRTEVLTPVTDPVLESKLVQYLQNGWVKFDIDAGRIHSKQMDLDKSVVGFAGNESRMQYLARLTEEVLPPEPATASRPTAGAK